MMRDIRGEVALITGASRGIGRAAAGALAQAGCHVALVARSQQELEDTAAFCRSLQPNDDIQTMTIAIDITDRDELLRAVEQCVEQLGGLDILVNNAGIREEEHAAEAALDAWDRAIDVNLRAAMALTRFALPHVQSAPNGAVVFIAGLAGKMGHANSTSYCASKHGIVGFSSALFEDIRESGTKVCAICPNDVNTNLVEHGFDQQHMLQPEDVADAILFVAQFPSTGCPTEIILRPQRTPRAEQILPQEHIAPHSSRDAIASFEADEIPPEATHSNDINDDPFASVDSLNALPPDVALSNEDLHAVMESLDALDAVAAPHVDDDAEQTETNEPTAAVSPLSSPPEETTDTSLLLDTAETNETSDAPVATETVVHETPSVQTDAVQTDASETTEESDAITTGVADAQATIEPPTKEVTDDASTEIADTTEENNAEDTNTSLAPAETTSVEITTTPAETDHTDVNSVSTPAELTSLANVPATPNVVPTEADAEVTITTSTVSLDASEATDDGDSIIGFDTLDGGALLDAAPMPTMTTTLSEDISAEATPTPDDAIVGDGIPLGTSGAPDEDVMTTVSVSVEVSLDGNEETDAPDATEPPDTTEDTPVLASTETPTTQEANSDNEIAVTVVLDESETPQPDTMIPEANVATVSVATSTHDIPIETTNDDVETAAALEANDGMLTVTVATEDAPDTPKTPEDDVANDEVTQDDVPFEISVSSSSLDVVTVVEEPNQTSETQEETSVSVTVSVMGEGDLPVTDEAQENPPPVTDEAQMEATTTTDASGTDEAPLAPASMPETTPSTDTAETTVETQAEATAEDASPTSEDDDDFELTIDVAPIVSAAEVVSEHSQETQPGSAVSDGEEGVAAGNMVSGGEAQTVDATESTSPQPPTTQDTKEEAEANAEVGGIEKRDNEGRANLMTSPSDIQSSSALPPPPDSTNLIPAPRTETQPYGISKELKNKALSGEMPAAEDRIPDFTSNGVESASSPALTTPAPPTPAQATPSASALPSPSTAFPPLVAPDLDAILDSLPTGAAGAPLPTLPNPGDVFAPLPPLSPSLTPATPMTPPATAPTTPAQAVVPAAAPLAPPTSPAEPTADDDATQDSLDNTLAQAPPVTAPEVEVNIQVDVDEDEVESTLHIARPPEDQRALLRELPDMEEDADTVFEEMVQSLEMDEFKVMEVLGTAKRMFWTPLRETPQQVAYENIVAFLHTLDLSPIRRAILDMARTITDDLCAVYDDQLNDLVETGTLRTEEKGLYLISAAQKDRILVDIRSPFREFIERLEQLDTAQEGLLQLLHEHISTQLGRLPPLLEPSLKEQLDAAEDAEAIESVWRVMLQAMSAGLAYYQQEAAEEVAQLLAATEGFLAQFEATYTALLNRIIELWSDRLMPPLNAILNS